ncbi:hypothetical protein ACGRPS_17090 [Vibrio furnissii]|uniref:hypothetical protein n=1 Tax=Vibrio furnissii TaxID=29494 RepID=UPI003747EDF0
MSVKRKSVKPARQGDLDGACGFYAIVNAIHILEPELDRIKLLDWAMRGYLVDGDPMNFFRGTYRGSVKNTLRRLIDRLNNHPDFELVDDMTNVAYEFDFSMPFWMDCPDREKVLEYLTNANNKEGRVCIMAYDYDDGDREPYAHWTVIKGVTDGQLLTHDSSGEIRKIGLDRLRVDAENNKHKSRPFNIRGKDIFIIYRKLIN